MNILNFMESIKYNQKILEYEEKLLYKAIAEEIEILGKKSWEIRSLVTDVEICLVEKYDNHVESFSLCHSEKHWVSYKDNWEMKRDFLDVIKTIDKALVVWVTGYTRIKC